MGKLSNKAKYPIGCFGKNYFDLVEYNWITWVCFKNYLATLTWHVRHYTMTATCTPTERKLIMDRQLSDREMMAKELKNPMQEEKFSKSHLITKYISSQNNACFRCNKIFGTFWIVLHY